MKHGKSILPHDKRDCMFVTKVEDAYQETEVNTSYRGEGGSHEVIVP